MDDLEKTLKSSGEVLSVLYERAYLEIKPQVEYIIENNIKDNYLIEQFLDRLLNLPTEECYALFLLLCEYTSRFEKEIAEDYLTYYNELYGNDLPKPTLTKKKELKNKIDMI